MEILSHLSIKEKLLDQEPHEYYLGNNSERAFKLNYIPSGFDIETYTQYKKDADGKVIMHYTNMYIAMFKLGDCYVECRSWDEVSDVFKVIEEVYCNTNKTKYLMFIHNQNFEFAFMGKELHARGHQVSVFARTKRKPMKIEIDDKIIILDSAKITGFSLKKLAENFTKTQKAVGDLDYSLPRNRFTTIHGTIDEGERKYIYNDVQILKEYGEYYEKTFLQDKKQQPMTQTMVANMVMKDIIKELKCQKDVYYLMSRIYPKSRQQYDYQMLFFQGAYTHGMLCNLFLPIYDDLAYDMQSQYPYVTMSKYFPMSGFKKLHTLNKWKFFARKYCCLMDVTLTNVMVTYGVTILSKHKVTAAVNAQWDNGRLYSCDSVRCFITEVDLQYLQIYYNFDIKVNALSYAKRGYLPDYFRLTVAYLYDKKQQLKGVPGKEAEYAVTKASLNGESYGACCTRLTFENNIFSDGEWMVEDNEIKWDKLWMGKNKSPAWAIYITSWARYMILAKGIAPIVKVNPHDYIYSDTDSCKVRNREYIKEHFEKVNMEIMKDNEKFVQDLNLHERYPNTNFLTMGIFDREEDMTVFKTLGSKKYLCHTEKHGWQTTVAGLPKGKYVEWCDRHNKDYLESFNLDTVDVCDWESGKLCTYYEDNPKQFTVVDYQGNVEEVYTESFVSLIPTSFSIKENRELIKMYNLELIRQNAIGER